MSSGMQDCPCKNCLSNRCKSSKHCGRLFSADKERKSTKVYCSKRCQEAEKDERAKAHRKRARAEARRNEAPN